jgi:hypothetical protein
MIKQTPTSYVNRMLIIVFKNPPDILSAGKEAI